MGRAGADRVSPGRRSFLTRGDPLALPWTDAARVMERCTGCGACAEACPQDILHIRGGTHPEIAFTDACSFCAACAEACPEQVFDLDRDPPWQAVARVGGGCLEANGVSCRACEDACEARALRARPQIGGSAVMVVDEGACTGCGACVPSA
jgi:MinD superfamily P-loop ATPase containing an inserted ferredoxin domain